MPRGPNTEINWIIDIYKTREHLDNDFIERKFYSSVKKITDEFKCSRASVYNYLNSNKSYTKLSCLKINRVKIQKKIEIHNPEYLKLII